MRKKHVMLSGQVKAGLARALTGTVAAAVVALAAAPSYAQKNNGIYGYEVGLEAYKKKQYDVAFDVWQRYAVAGDVQSMKVLGDFFSNAVIINTRGRDIERENQSPPNFVEALKWYTLAAHHDFSQQLRAPETAERNAQILADDRLPDIRAQMTNAQVDEAERLVAATYERGSPRDILYVAEMYLRGAGLRKDNVRAYQLYLVASERGVPDASLALEKMRDDELVSEAEIDRAERLAANWRPPLPALHQGDTPEVRELRRLRAEIEELRLQDALEAVSDIDVELIQQALRALGHYRGEIDNAMGPQTRKAVRRFQATQVASREDMTAVQKKNAETGVLSARDTVSLFRDAASLAEHDMSQYVYGIMHVRGIGVEQDGAQAVRWLKAAAGQNLALAHYGLCVVYRDGTPGLNPVTPDKALAALHCAKAESLGYAPAGRALELIEFEVPSKVE